MSNTISALKLVHDYLVIYLPKQRNFSENTIIAYKTAINQFFDFICDTFPVSLTQLSVEHFSSANLQSFSDYLYSKNYADATVTQRLRGLHSFLKYASIHNPEYIVFSKEFKNVAIKKETEKPVDYMSEDAVKAMLAEPDLNTRIGLRDISIMSLLYDTGARVSELIGIKIKDLRLDSGLTVTLHGKGKKIRIVPLMENTVSLLKHYIEEFHNDIYDSENYLFYTIRNSIQTKMSDDNIRRLLAKYAGSASKNCSEIPANMHQHLWRHSRAMHLYKGGMDLSLISQWLGHSTIAVTQIYAYADVEHKRKAIVNASIDFVPNSKSILYKVSDEELLRKLYGLK